ncbi:MAG: HEAT repeat domain-containing protein, partial [Pyrinomonadaceae bacterium]|nr:HEAT repeat domain-containing protein [Phycisphaerales bacterium]
MPDWTWLSYLIGGGLAVLGAGIIVVAMFRNRSRGRKRCPRCWYDMSASPTLKCSECGRAARSPRHLLKTRRHWRWVFAGMMVVLLGGVTAIAPAAYTGKWVEYTPASVLNFGLSFFDEAAEREYNASLGSSGYGRFFTTGVTPGLGGVPPIGSPFGVTPPSQSVWKQLLIARHCTTLIKKQTQPNRSANSNYYGYYAGGSPESELVALGSNAKPAFPLLLSMLRSDDDGIRGDALTLIKHLGAGATGLQPALCDMLTGDSNIAPREAAASALSHMAITARTRSRLFQIALKDPNPRIRRSVMFCLGVFAPSDPSILPVVQQGLLDVDEGVREASMVSLDRSWFDHEAWGSWGTKAFSEFSPGWNRVVGSTTPVSQPTPDEGVLRLAMSMLADPSAKVRTAAAYYIWASLPDSSDAAVALVGAAKKEPNSTVRYLLLRTLVRLMPTAEMVALLTQLVEDHDSYSVWAIAELSKWGAFATPALPAILEFMGSSDGETVALCVITMARIPGVSPRSMHPFLLHESLAVRLASARAFQTSLIDPCECASDLLALAGDENMQLSAAAIRALKYCQDDADRVITRLEDVSGRTPRMESSELLRIEIVSTLANAGRDKPGRIVPMLIGMLDDPSAIIRQYVAFQLGNLG